MIVGIDVGNTAIKWTSDADEQDVRSVRLSAPRAIEKVTDDLFQHSGNLSLDVRIASVNRSVGSSLAQRLRITAPQSSSDALCVRSLTRSDLALLVDVDFPERVGIDRLVGAWGAATRYSSPLVIIDAGTTVTIDLVNADGVYQGGAILPGLAMQTSALASGTDALPRIDWQTCEPSIHTAKPGKHTVAAIRLGVLSSVVGGIERLVRVYGSPETVVVTGGDAVCVSQELGIPHHVEKHLVCRTLLRV